MRLRSELQLSPLLPPDTEFVHPLVRGIVMWRSRSHKIADVSLDLPLPQKCRHTEGVLRSVPVQYSLVLTMRIDRLGWLELFVTSSEDVYFTWSSITLWKSSHSDRGVLVSISLEIATIWLKISLSLSQMLDLT